MSGVMHFVAYGDPSPHITSKLMRLASALHLGKPPNVGATVGPELRPVAAHPCSNYPAMAATAASSESTPALPDFFSKYCSISVANLLTVSGQLRATAR